MGIVNQVVCTLIASFLCFILGVSSAWPATNLLIFPFENTTLERPMDQTELSLVTSLSSVGALIGTPIIGILLDIIGRKNSAVVAGLTCVLAWTMLATCIKVEAVLVAVFLTGVGGSSLLIVPVFVGEICQESIRGAMTSSSMIFYGVGTLAAYVFGGFLDYYSMIYVCLGLTILAVLSLWFLRETPLCLMKKGLDREAQKSFAFYRSEPFDSILVLQEMEALRRAFNPVMDEDVDETKAPGDEETENLEQQKPEKMSFIRFIKKSRATRRAIVITLVLITSAIFQGLIAVLVNAERVFQATVPSMSPKLCSMLLVLTSTIAGVVAAYLIDLSGRRPLMIYASIGSGVSCVLIGTQIQLTWGPEWLTAILIFVYAVMYNLGAGTVPFVFLVEVFLPEMKSIMTMLAVEWAWLCNFIVLFNYEFLSSAMGLGPVFYIFAIISILSALFSSIYQPETKGMAIDEIQRVFDKPIEREFKSCRQYFISMIRIFKWRTRRATYYC